MACLTYKSPMIKKFLQRIRSNLLLLIALASLIAASLVVMSLSHRAERDISAHKSREALEFETHPDEWLDRQTNAADFLRALNGGQLSAVGLDESEPGLVLYTRKDATKASTRVPGCTLQGCAGTLLATLGDKSVTDGFAWVSIQVDTRPASRRVLDVLMNLLSPLLLIGGVIATLYVSLRFQTQMGGAATQLAARPTSRFADVVGQEEAKAALNRVTAFMHDPAQYAKIGAVAPRGVLLVGPPGTGKTLLAKALAGESGANFIAVDGSYFTASFYGAGVNKVKALFKLARKHAPCVLFIDEVDGIGKRSAGANQGGGESELNRIINRVLVEMDGFSSLENVVMVAATNHEDNIDAAMRRPGRFDMLVRLSSPTLPERQKLFDLYVGRLSHDGKIDSAGLARMTAGLSPADIANIVNKAASAAAESGAAQVGSEHLLGAIETHQLGGEVSPVKDLFTQDLRDRLAYHEAGHALVAHWLDAGLVERVTIEPRGRALGVTYITRASEDPLYKQAELTGRLAMLLAGREAELLVFDSVSTGASDDLKRASELAISMVGSLGFSETFGLLSVAGVPKELLGPDIQKTLLGEARAMLDRAQATCQRLLRSHRAQLDALARRLLEREAIAGEELKELLGAPLRYLSGTPVTGTTGSMAAPHRN